MEQKGDPTSRERAACRMSVGFTAAKVFPWDLSSWTKRFSRNEILKRMKMFLAELGIVDAIGKTGILSILLVVCVLGKGGSKLKQAQTSATGRTWGIENLL